MILIGSRVSPQERRIGKRKRPAETGREAHRRREEQIARTSRKSPCEFESRPGIKKPLREAIFSLLHDALEQTHGRCIHRKAPLAYPADLDVIERGLVAVEGLGKPLNCSPQAILERHLMLPTEKPFGLAGIGDQPLNFAIGRTRAGR